MARTGAEYIEALKTRPPNLWYKGEKVEDPTTHPVFRGIVRTMAALYDLLAAGAVPQPQVPA